LTVRSETGEAGFCVVLLGLVSLEESNYIETVYLGLLSHHPHFLSAAALFLRSRCLACALFAFLPLSRLRSLVVAVCPALRALFPLCLLFRRYRRFISAFCASFSFPSCWVCPATRIRQIRQFLHPKKSRLPPILRRPPYWSVRSTAGLTDALDHTEPSTRRSGSSNTYRLHIHNINRDLTGLY
jgi:hypothetical protein